MHRSELIREVCPHSGPEQAVRLHEGALITEVQSLWRSEGLETAWILALVALLGGYVVAHRLLRQSRRRELRERARAAESRARRDSLLESALDCIITADHDGRVIDFNPAAEKTFGYSRAEVERKPLADLIVPPSLRARHLEGMNRYRSTGEGRILGQRIEVMAMRKGGEQFPVELAINAIELEGKPLFTAYLRDISQRKREEGKLREAEAKYRTLVEKLPAVVYTAEFGTSGRWHYVSPKIKSILGYSPEEWLADPSPWYERLHPEDRDRTMRAEQHSDSTRHDFKCEYRMLDRDGRLVWFRDESTVMGNDSGGSALMHGVMLDITDQKELQDQLRQSQKMEAVGQLAGGVAHDFNNLLSVMLNNAVFVGEALAPDDPAQEDLAEIYKAAERAAGLTKQLLLFSRKEVARPQVVDLNDVIAGLEKFLRHSLGERIVLRVEPAPKVWPTVIDTGQVEQIVINLAVNARDAMPDGGELIIRTANERVEGDQEARRLGLDPGQYVRIAVTDNGRGMSEQEIARIFEPFYTTKARGSGTGLGLSTVYGIVQQAGGAIAVDSAVGVGSTFSIYLRASPERSTEHVAGGRENLPAGNGVTILVAEDEGAIRHLVHRILSTDGYKVLTATSGEDALDVLKRHGKSVDVLLTDVVMPRMSGKELAERVLKVQPKTRVVYMSGYTDNIIAQHGVLDESEVFLQKPFTRDDLLRKIGSVVPEATRAAR